MFNVIENVNRSSKVIAENLSAENAMDVAKGFALFWGGFFSGSAIAEVKNGFEVVRPNTHSMVFVVEEVI